MWKAWSVDLCAFIISPSPPCGKSDTCGPWLLLDWWLGILHTNPELPVGPTLQKCLSKQNPSLKVHSDIWHILAYFQLKCTLYRQIRGCLINSCSSKQLFYLFFCCCYVGLWPNLRIQGLIHGNMYEVKVPTRVNHECALKYNVLYVWIWESTVSATVYGSKCGGPAQSRHWLGYIWAMLCNCSCICLDRQC